ncbi:MAG: hydrogenase nickel incorporation protein HypA, partial [Syntrophus sp. (in: bacteria)]|nr:hydrogenase nickel incorporation protein HypA [Syntrophus sp. (in: bacteria)]
NIRIERIPVVFRCEACGETHEVKLSERKDVICPACGSAKASLLSGREFTVQQIEVI